MLSHDNLTWMAQTLSKHFKITSEDSVLSFLPLSHVSVQMMDIWLPMATGACVSFVEKKSSLAKAI